MILKCDIYFFNLSLFYNYPHYYSLFGKVVIFDTKEEDLEQQVLMLYEDEQKNENFYVCDWTVLMKQGRNPFLVLAVAGFTGVIKLLYPSCNDSKKSGSSSDDEDRVSVLVGHGQDVNDLKFHKRYFK